MQVVGEGDDGEDARDKTRGGRGEHETVDEEGGYPLADAKLAGQELSPMERLSPLPRGFSWTLLGLSFSFSSVNGARRGLEAIS